MDGKSTNVTFEVARVDRDGVTLDVLDGDGKPRQDQTLIGLMTRSVKVPRLDAMLTAQPGDRFVLTPTPAVEDSTDG